MGGWKVAAALAEHAPYHNPATGGETSETLDPNVRHKQERSVRPPGSERDLPHGYILIRYFDSLDAVEDGPVTDVLASARCFEVISFNVISLDVAGRTSATARSKADRAGQIVSALLFARRAGVHIDFHAHRHFDNRRSFPGHSAPPK
jgi:hypothetical protein